MTKYSPASTVTCSNLQPIAFQKLYSHWITGNTMTILPMGDHHVGGLTSTKVQSHQQMNCCHPNEVRTDVILATPSHLLKHVGIIIIFFLSVATIISTVWQPAILHFSGLAAWPLFSVYCEVIYGLRVCMCAKVCSCVCACEYFARGRSFHQQIVSR